MSELYTSLQVSPRKKRCPPPEFDDEYTTTPKRLRTAPPTPPATASRKLKSKKINTSTTAATLPAHLARLNTLQTGLQHALSHALATCAVSPSSDTGLVRNVLNNFSLTTYTGLAQFDVDDLKRLCWIWEWDANSLAATTTAKNNDDEIEEDNPFVDSEPAEQSKDWTRGSMGIVISPTTHHPKAGGKRITAYGIGIEVEMDIDKDMAGGMAAVARWTAGAEARRKDFRAKLDKWISLNNDSTPIPQIPFANIPTLITPLKPSTLTRALASASPKSLSARSHPEPPSSPTRSPVKRSAPLREFAIPFSLPSSSSSPASKNSLLFPQTPSSRHRRAEDARSLLTPGTPSTSRGDDPVTPSHQRGRDATTVPQTPTSSLRQALYDRIRERSLSPSKPSTPSSKVVPGGGSTKMSKEQLAKLSQEEMRRRCLLGRLDGIAESAWMLFSTPASGSSATLSTRKRRALPLSTVSTAIIKSSPVPISSAEANESLNILTSLCPFFLRPLNIGGEEWLEMPAPAEPSPDTPAVDDKDGEDKSGGSKRKKGKTTTTTGKKGQSMPTPPSPGHLRTKHESEHELVTRSPRRVKQELGGLRQVRQIIEREMQLQD